MANQPRRVESTVGDLASRVMARAGEYVGTSAFVRVGPYLLVPLAEVDHEELRGILREPALARRLATDREPILSPERDARPAEEVAP